ncbi:MAG: DNA translocase FtsK 4TM domain-containing protein [Flavobacteriaceae bacterium]
MAKKQKRVQSNSKLIRQRQVLFGSGMILVGLLLTIAFISYLIHWKEDYSTLNSLADRSVIAQNLLNKLGAFVSHFFIYQGVGLAAILFPSLLGLSGFKLFFDKKTDRLITSWAWGLAHILWLSIALGYLFPMQPLFSGIVGYEINMFLIDYVGNIGIALLLAFSGLIFIVIKLNFTPKKLIDYIKNLFKTKDLNQSEELFETENIIKEETKATIRCIPLNGNEESGSCMVTGNPSSKRVLFAKAY